MSFGIVNTTRFLNQFTMGYGNYTEEREQILGDLTVDEIVAEIQKKLQDYKSQPVPRSRLKQRL